MSENNILSHTANAILEKGDRRYRKNEVPLKELC